MSGDKIIKINGLEIRIKSVKKEDYISLTDMARLKNKDEPDSVVKNWLRLKNTVKYLGLWERLSNKEFNSIEFDRIKQEAGENSFTLSPSKWIKNTNAIGIKSSAGRYSKGVFAYIDIAFKFASWLSVEFELFLVKDYQRLKKKESDAENTQWSLVREFSKFNYHLQTNAIENHIILNSDLPEDKQGIEYTIEADLLNQIVFGTVAKKWREDNADLHKKGYNMRDEASANQLTVLSNLEASNSEMIKKGINKKERFRILTELKESQLTVLDNKKPQNSIRKNLRKNKDDENKPRIKSGFTV